MRIGGRHRQWGQKAERVVDGCVKYQKNIMKNRSNILGIKFAYPASRTVSHVVKQNTARSIRPKRQIKRQVVCNVGGDASK